MNPRVLRATALAAALCALPRLARAHSEAVHAGMVDFSYQTMRVVDFELDHMNTLDWIRPPGVATADWWEFLNATRAGYQRLAAAPGDLPPSTRWSDCTASPPVGAVPVGSTPWAVNADYLWADGCRVDAAYVPGGIFNLPPAPGADFTANGGTVLGTYAASVDHLNDDSHMWIRPTSIAGLGMIKDIAGKAWKSAVGIVLVPIVCAWEWIFGGDDCSGDAMDAADASNPVDQLDGIIPGFGDVSGGDYVTLWHFINVQDGASNSYDDNQGMFYDEAGLYGVPDAADLAIMAWSDGLGWSFNYDKSDGISHYTDLESADGAPTRPRDKAKWQALPFAHTPVEPLDNLAAYGWRQFTTDPRHSAKWLAWPLHALGDAVAPHHTIGSSGWGHEPFEAAVARMWHLIRYVDVGVRNWQYTGGAVLDPTRDPSTPIGGQIGLVKAVLQEAYFQRRAIIDWRAAHPGLERDQPVRAIVTALAKTTLAEAHARADWPFDPFATAAYHAGMKESSTENYMGPTGIDRARVTLTHGMGAMVAFLGAAGEAL